MEIIPLYFFIGLFLAIMYIYTFKNKQYYIEKNKK